MATIFINFLGIAFCIARVSLKWFLTLWFLGRKRVVPPIKDPLLLKSAISLASDIREEHIKSEDVINSYITRIREVNPYINAVCHERFEDAINEARNVDKLVASHIKSARELESEKPFLGVPFTAKMVLGVKGMPLNAASLIHKGAIAHEDAESVVLMKNAGAICLATTNIPEFSCTLETYNFIYGRTSNPYDTTKTAGGSSGGECALIGSGGSLIGLGNDLGGSIRCPSHFNGVFGHKSTAGLIPNNGAFPVLPPKMNDYAVAGPICRYAEDLVLATKILSGGKAEHRKFGEVVDFSKTKLYYLLEDEYPLSQKVDQDMKDTIMKAVYHFQSTYKTEAKIVNIKGIKGAYWLYCNLVDLSMEDGKLEDIALGEMCKINPGKEFFKSIFGLSKVTFFPLTAMMFFKFIRRYRLKRDPDILGQLQQLQGELEAILDDNSVLFLPSFCSKAPYHYSLPLLTTSVCFWGIFNVLGLPVTHCPAGLSDDNLPLGLQVAGAKGQDQLTIAFAMEIEKAFKGWVPPNAS